MRWTVPRKRNCSHLIRHGFAVPPSPHRGRYGGAQVQSLPFQGRWLGEAETERSQQICYNLSVTFGDSSPERGALGACKSI